MRNKKNLLVSLVLDINILVVIIIITITNSLSCIFINILNMATAFLTYLNHPRIMCTPSICGHWNTHKVNHFIFKGRNNFSLIFQLYPKPKTKLLLNEL